MNTMNSAMAANPSRPTRLLIGLSLALGADNGGGGLAVAGACPVAEQVGQDADGCALEDVGGFAVPELAGQDAEAKKYSAQCIKCKTS